MNAASVDAVILCGGLGTRLGLADLPKPMADINGRPFLEILVEWAAEQGLRRFIFCAGHKAGAIKEHFKPKPGREYHFSEEKEPLGTGGALKLAEPLLKSKPVLVLNGDTYCALDVQALLDFHAKTKAVATISLAPARERTDGGFVALDKDKRILSFAEKDPRGGSWLNAGILVLERDVFTWLQAGKFCSFEKDMLPKLLSKGVYGYTTEASLYDIGTPERLESFRRRQGTRP